VKLIVSAAAASVQSRIVDTFGQRANDQKDTTPRQTKLKVGGCGGEDEKRRLERHE